MVEEDNKKSQQQRAAVELYQGHRDFAWVQFRAIAVVQIAFFAAFWAAVKDIPILAMGILFVGAITMFSIRLLMGRHFETCRYFREAAGDLMPNVPKPKWLRSDDTAIWLIYFLIIANIAVACSSWHISSILKNAALVTG